jgi:hypothetical protein
MLALCVAAPASATGRNPYGYGIYTPEPRVRGEPRLYRYDPRSWYYRQRGYYAPYVSGYWVPRPEMRYRYRHKYVGPKYMYVPAWGYGWCEGRRYCR